LDGLVRVDLFVSNEKKLVVNEIEGIEAVYFASNVEKENAVDTFLNNYWEKKIYQNLARLYE